MTIIGKQSLLMPTHSSILLGLVMNASGSREFEIVLFDCCDHVNAFVE